MGDDAEQNLQHASHLQVEGKIVDRKKRHCLKNEY